MITEVSQTLKSREESFRTFDAQYASAGLPVTDRCNIYIDIDSKEEKARSSVLGSFSILLNRKVDSIHNIKVH